MAHHCQATISYSPTERTGGQVGRGKGGEREGKGRGKGGEREAAIKEGGKERGRLE